MAKFYMFYGVQVYEFERPAIVAKPGKAKIAGHQTPSQSQTHNNQGGGEE